jgi:hypothetical protein
MARLRKTFALATVRANHKRIDNDPLPNHRHTRGRGLEPNATRNGTAEQNQAAQSVQSAYCTLTRVLWTGLVQLPQVDLEQIQLISDMY